MKKLIGTDILAICLHGVKHSSGITCVCIKRLPLDNNTGEENKFVSVLSEYKTYLK